VPIYLPARYVSPACEKPVSLLTGNVVLSGSGG
jgi:hypothetical protein